jgi:hypothetical protein
MTPRENPDERQMPDKAQRSTDHYIVPSMTKDLFDQASVNAFFGLPTITRCQEHHSVTGTDLSDHLTAHIRIKESSRRKRHFSLEASGTIYAVPE